MRKTKKPSKTKPMLFLLISPRDLAAILVILASVWLILLISLGSGRDEPREQGKYPASMPQDAAAQDQWVVGNKVGK